MYEFDYTFTYSYRGVKEVFNDGCPDEVEKSGCWSEQHVKCEGDYDAITYAMEVGKERAEEETGFYPVSGCVLIEDEDRGISIELGLDSGDIVSYMDNGR